MIANIVIMIIDGVITMGDLNNFSEDFRRIVVFFGRIIWN